MSIVISLRDKLAMNKINEKIFIVLALKNYVAKNINEKL